MPDYFRPVIPVKIRTARKQHRCDGFLCDVPIQPGERYEIHSAPPWSDGNESPQWAVAKVHLSPPGGWFGSGCEAAAAHYEKQQRETRSDWCNDAVLAEVAAGGAPGNSARP